MAAPIAIYVESGATRTFAVAIDWPGWARGAKNANDAVAALAAYGQRYARVVMAAAPGLSPPTDTAGFRIAKRVKGGSGTDFGVPSVELPADRAPLTAAEVARFVRILEASWAAFDRAADAARGLSLRTGPRGGGRDLAKMTAHVVEADAAYVVQLGARAPKGASASALRDAMIEAFRARALGRAVAEPSKAMKPWTPRYFARRVAWHALDHAWELEDRAIRA